MTSGPRPSGFWYARVMEDSHRKGEENILNHPRGRELRAAGLNRIDWCLPRWALDARLEWGVRPGLSRSHGFVEPVEGSIP